MATKYADFDLATGNNDGSDWTNAWKTMADAIAGSNSAPPAGGDTVYCRGTDTLAGTVTLNIEGDLVAPLYGNLIRWIGVNASGVEDGTRATLTANGGNFNVLTGSGYANLFKNFRFTGSGNGSGVAGTKGYCVFINCSFDTNGAYGYSCSDGRNCDHFIRCTSYGNINGFYVNIESDVILCSSHDNVGFGFYAGSGRIRFYGCIAYDNAYGFQEIAGNNGLFNCVADGNSTVGMHTSASILYVPLIGCRITNNAVGLDGNDMSWLLGWCDFDGNTDHLLDTDPCVFLTNDAGSDTNVYLNENGAGGGDTNQGYVSVTEGSEDYSTNYVSGTDPHIRRTAITIPVS